MVELETTSCCSIFGESDERIALFKRRVASVHLTPISDDITQTDTHTHTRPLITRRRGRR